MLNEISLGLFYIKEEQKEPIELAYIRFLKGQFDVEINHFAKFDQEENDSGNESDDYIMVEERKYADDFDIDYSHGDYNIIDVDEIQLLSKKLIKSDLDAYSHNRNNLHSDSSIMFKSKAS